MRVNFASSHYNRLPYVVFGSPRFAMHITLWPGTAAHPCSPENMHMTFDDPTLKDQLHTLLGKRHIGGILEWANAARTRVRLSPEFLVELKRTLLPIYEPEDKRRNRLHADVMTFLDEFEGVMNYALQNRSGQATAVAARRDNDKLGKSHPLFPAFVSPWHFHKRYHDAYLSSLAGLAPVPHSPCVPEQEEPAPSPSSPPTAAPSPSSPPTAAPPPTSIPPTPLMEWTGQEFLWFGESLRPESTISHAALSSLSEEVRLLGRMGKGDGRAPEAQPKGAKGTPSVAKVSWVDYVVALRRREIPAATDPASLLSPLSSCMLGEETGRGVAGALCEDLFHMGQLVISMQRMGESVADMDDVFEAVADLGVGIVKRGMAGESGGREFLNMILHECLLSTFFAPMRVMGNGEEEEEEEKIPGMLLLGPSRERKVVGFDVIASYVEILFARAFILAGYADRVVRMCGVDETTTVDDLNTDLERLGEVSEAFYETGHMDQRTSGLPAAISSMGKLFACMVLAQRAIQSL
jgi:hypothetical protein